MNASNPLCPACQAKRQHTAGERTEFHPLAGHGYSPESGWTFDRVTELKEERQG